MNPNIICTCLMGNPSIHRDKDCPVHGDQPAKPAEEEIPGLNKSTENWSKIKDKDEWLNEVRGEENKSEVEEFLNCVNKTRDKFVITIDRQDWNTQMRTAAEDLLIIYDQMKERLASSNTQEGQEKEIERLCKEAYTDARTNYHNVMVKDWWPEFKLHNNL